MKNNDREQKWSEWVREIKMVTLFETWIYELIPSQTKPHSGIQMNSDLQRFL